MPGLPSSPVAGGEDRVPARSEFRAKFRSKKQLPIVTKGILDSRGYGVNEPRRVVMASWRTGQARRRARLQASAAPLGHAGHGIGPRVSMLIYWSGAASLR